jgi:hypothetical protein
VESDESDNNEEENSSNTQEGEMGGIASFVGILLFPSFFLSLLPIM